MSGMNYMDPEKLRSTQLNSGYKGKTTHIAFFHSPATSINVRFYNSAIAFKLEQKENDTQVRHIMQCFSNQIYKMEVGSKAYTIITRSKRNKGCISSSRTSCNSPI